MAFLLDDSYVVRGTPGLDSTVGDKVDLGIGQGDPNDILYCGGFVIFFDPLIASWPIGWSLYFVCYDDAVADLQSVG